MRSLDEVAHDLHWCAPWAVELFDRLLDEYRQLLRTNPDEEHLQRLRVWEGNAPGRRRHCYPPVALARPGLEAIVRAEVMSRGARLMSRLSGPAAAEVSTLFAQFESQRPVRPGLEELGRLLRGLRRQGARLRCQLRDWPLELPAPLSEVAYEIVAEGLRNALRHGDGSGRVSLVVERAPFHLRLRISNPLAGPLCDSGSGLGLRHLRWRVRTCEGRYRFGQVGRRARLEVLLPLAIAP